MFIKEEEVTLEFDEGGKIFGFLAGAVVDFHFDFSHVEHGDVVKEYGVGNTVDQLAN